jgi:flagellar biosynthesis protein FlhB
LGTLIFITYENLSIENNSAAFSRDFPTWRGIALFILYIWILGFDVYCFERYKISHRLIFTFNDHHYSSSSSVFKIAGFYTALFMVIFLLYLLLVTNIIVNQSSFRTEYLVLFVWLALIVYLIMPLPIFNHEGRLYAIKLILRSLASPFMGV